MYSLPVGLSSQHQRNDTISNYKQPWTQEVWHCLTVRLFPSQKKQNVSFVYHHDIFGTRNDDVRYTYIIIINHFALVSPSYLITSFHSLRSINIQNSKTPFVSFQNPNLLNSRFLRPFLNAKHNILIIYVAIVNVTQHIRNKCKRVSQE